MKTVLQALLIPSILLSFAGMTRGQSPDTTATDLMQRYLALPTESESAPIAQARIQRLQALRKLAATDDDPVSLITLELARATNRVHRLELIEVLGWIPTEESAALASSYLHDPDDKVRAAVILALRRLSMRISRLGHVAPRGPDAPPKVEGLLPHLVDALSNSTPTNRNAAVFALADTRDPAALEPMRSMLEDPSPSVRFHAACLLTEMGDFSGISELTAALDRLTQEEPGRSLALGLSSPEFLFAALERVTGQSLGEIPMNPLLRSNMSGAEEAREDTRALLARWSEWWKEHGAEYE